FRAGNPRCPFYADHGCHHDGASLAGRGGALRDRVLGVPSSKPLVMRRRALRALAASQALGVVALTIWHLLDGTEREAPDAGGANPPAPLLFWCATRFQSPRQKKTGP